MLALLDTIKQNVVERGIWYYRVYGPEKVSEYTYSTPLSDLVRGITRLDDFNPIIDGLFLLTHDMTSLRPHVCSAAK